MDALPVEIKTGGKDDFAGTLHKEHKPCRSCIFYQQSVGTTMNISVIFES
jgi:hypothetical protein